MFVFRMIHGKIVPHRRDFVMGRGGISGIPPGWRKNIADCLGVDVEKVNVKATTTEKLGFEGREEGISSYAVCLLK